MKLEDQVCSLELSKQLKEFGVKQESLFFWIETGCPQCSLKNELVYAYKATGDKPSNCYSSFTVAELGELLPNFVQVKGYEPFDNYRILINKFHSVSEDGIITNNYIVNYECDTVEAVADYARPKLCKSNYDPNLSNAMAKMYIYLMENGLLKNEHS